MSGAKIVIVEAQGSIHDRFGRSLERQGHQTEYLAPEGDVARRIASRRCDMVLAAEGMTSIGTAELMFRLQENRVAVSGPYHCQRGLGAPLHRGDTCRCRRCRAPVR